MNKTKLALFAALAALFGAVLWLGPEEYLNLGFVQSKLEQLLAYRRAHPFAAALAFAGVYIAVTAASIPAASVLTLVCGAVFGFVLGSLIAVTSATIGATIAFYLARYLFDDWVRQKMGARVSKIRDNFRREGALYLFSMRLVPAFPFFAVNLLMGLTSIRTSQFMLASFIGMAPGSMVYVNAGTQLAELDSLSGLLSPALFASFILLAVFPYAARYFLRVIRKRLA